MVGLSTARRRTCSTWAATGAGPRCWRARSSAAQTAGLRTELLGMERDLDDAADARALAGHPRLPPAVAEVLG